MRFLPKGLLMHPTLIKLREAIQQILDIKQKAEEPNPLDTLMLPLATAAADAVVMLLQDVHDIAHAAREQLELASRKP